MRRAIAGELKEEDAKDGATRALQQTLFRQLKRRFGQATEPTVPFTFARKATP